MLNFHLSKSRLLTGLLVYLMVVQLANQPDMMFDDTSPAPGFLKAVFPCLRKGTRTNSMAWVKLVDDAGRTCGHAVLQARLVAMLGGEVGLSCGLAGARAFSVAAQPELLLSPHHSGHPDTLSIAAAAPPTASPSTQQQVQGFLGPPSAMSSAPIVEEFVTLSINQQAPPEPEPLPLPPVTTTMHVVRMEATGVPKQPSTSAGFLHVTAVQVYDELLNAALKATGCGPKRLVVEGPWLWLLGEFRMAYGVRDHYARLRWVLGLRLWAGDGLWGSALVPGLG